MTAGRKRLVLLLGTLGAVVVPGLIMAAVKYTFTAGNKIVADEINQNFKALDDRLTPWSRIDNLVVRMSGAAAGSSLSNQKTSAVSRRVGDSVEMRIVTEFMGAQSMPGAFVWELPAGLVLDSAKLPIAASYATVGVAEVVVVGSGYYACVVNASSAGLGVDCTGIQASFGPTHPATIGASGARANLAVTVPVVGW